VHALPVAVVCVGARADSGDSLGFASTVGTVAVTGRGVLTASIGNPGLMAAVALVLRGLFGIASERLGPMLAAKPSETKEAPA
jgi:hypothetical protein